MFGAGALGGVGWGGLWKHHGVGRRPRRHHSRHRRRVAAQLAPAGPKAGQPQEDGSRAWLVALAHSLDQTTIHDSSCHNPITLLELIIGRRHKDNLVN